MAVSKILLKTIHRRNSIKNISSLGRGSTAAEENDNLSSSTTTSPSRSIATSTSASPPQGHHVHKPQSDTEIREINTEVYLHTFGSHNTDAAEERETFSPTTASPSRSKASSSTTSPPQTCYKLKPLEECGNNDVTTAIKNVDTSLNASAVDKNETLISTTTSPSLSTAMLTLSSSHQDQHETQREKVDKFNETPTKQRTDICQNINNDEENEINNDKENESAVSTLASPLTVNAPKSVLASAQKNLNAQTQQIKGIETATTTSSIPQWTIGQIVNVSPRTWPGINRPGGCGYIVKIHTGKSDVDDSEVVTSLDVKYIISSGSDLNVPLEYVHRSCLDDVVAKTNRGDTARRSGGTVGRHTKRRSYDTSSEGDAIYQKPKRKYNKQKSAPHDSGQEYSTREKEDVENEKTHSAEAKDLLVSNNQSKEKDSIIHSPLQATQLLNEKNNTSKKRIKLTIPASYNGHHETPHLLSPDSLKGSKQLKGENNRAEHFIDNCDGSKNRYTIPRKKSHSTKNCDHVNKTAEKSPFHSFKIPTTEQLKMMYNTSDSVLTSVKSDISSSIRKKITYTPVRDSLLSTTEDYLSDSKKPSALVGTSSTQNYPKMTVLVRQSYENSPMKGATLITSTKFNNCKENAKMKQQNLQQKTIQRPTIVSNHKPLRLKIGRAIVRNEDNSVKDYRKTADKLCTTTTCNTSSTNCTTTVMNTLNTPVHHMKWTKQIPVVSEEGKKVLISVVDTPMNNDVATSAGKGRFFQPNSLNSTCSTGGIENEDDDIFAISGNFVNTTTTPHHCYSTKSITDNTAAANRPSNLNQNGTPSIQRD